MRELCRDAGRQPTSLKLIDRGTRLLFAFDSNGNAVMLLGGDKTRTWNRWYPSKVRETERREDMCLVALARYVGALGGRIEVRAVFDGDEILVRREPR